MTQSHQLVNKLWNYCNILRDDGLSYGDYVEQLTYLLFLKMDDERTKDPYNHKSSIPKKYTWQALLDKEGSELEAHYIETLQELGKEDGIIGVIFRKAQNKIQDPAKLRRLIVELINKENWLSLEADVKGDAYEGLLEKNAADTKSGAGQYFTPRPLINAIVEVMKPLPGMKIHDPACGTGGFLIQAFRHIKKKCKPTEENIKFLEEKTTWGNEITETAKIAKMNMIIIGDGHTNICEVDSLEHPVKGEFDVVLTNFPFSQTTKFSSLYEFNTKDANPVFLKHVIDALKDEGRAGVVVPDGLLFDKNAEYVKIRRLLLETCNLLAVIQLDPFVFKPYTGQPTSVLIFQKGKQTQKVWFFDVINDGFKKTGSKKGRPSIKENDMPLLRELWADKSNSEHSFSVDFETIKKNRYKLTMNAYKVKTKRKTPIKTLGELCEPPLLGGTPPRQDPECWNGENLWAKISDMKDMFIYDTDEKISDKGVEKSSVKKIGKGTLLFSFKLTVGKVTITGEELYTNEAIAALIPRDKTDKNLTKYLYYVLPILDYVPYAQRATKGSTLNSDSIVDVEVPFPSPEIREKIVKEGDNKEKQKQELLKKIAEINEEEAEFMRLHTS